MIASLLLVLLLAPVGAGQVDKKPEPKVTGLLLCELVDPPPKDANPNTITLSCHRHVTRNFDELQAISLQIPDTYATFAGKMFVMELLNNGSQRFAAEQPEGSTVRLSPPCPKKNSKLGYRIEPLQQGPCNPELTPQ